MSDHPGGLDDRGGLPVGRTATVDRGKTLFDLATTASPAASACIAHHLSFPGTVYHSRRHNKRPCCDGGGVVGPGLRRRVEISIIGY